MKNKLITTLFSLLLINPLFGSDTQSPSLRTIPILEVNGDQMPGWEKQIIERYHDENGDPIPVIFKGAAKNWEAASWTPEWFAENFGPHTIVVENSKIIEEEDLTITTIKDHINDIQLNPINSEYLTSSVYHNITKKVIEEEFYDIEDGFINNIRFIHNLTLETQTNFPQSKIISDIDNTPRRYFLFIGAENTITTLHSHGSTFLAQIYGKKIATLIHPKYNTQCTCEYKDDYLIDPCIDINENNFEQYKNLCQCSLDEIKYNQNREVKKCAVDIANPDFEKYPDLKDVEVYTTTLEPGDVLYIPHLWLHDIRALPGSPSISIASGF